MYKDTDRSGLYTHAFTAILVRLHASTCVFVSCCRSLSRVTVGFSRTDLGLVVELAGSRGGGWRVCRRQPPLHRRLGAAGPGGQTTSAARKGPAPATTPKWTSHAFTCAAACVRWPREAHLHNSCGARPCWSLRGRGTHEATCCIGPMGKSRAAASYAQQQCNASSHQATSPVAHRLTTQWQGAGPAAPREAESGRGRGGGQGQMTSMA